MPRFMTWVLLPLIVAGCMFGPRAELYPPTTRPGGTKAALNAGGHMLDAEVLAVRDTALLVLSSAQQVILVPYRTIREATFEDAKGIVIRRSAPGSAARNRLRLLSRYPQGVSPDLLRALLSPHGQSDLRMVQQ